VQVVEGGKKKAVIVMIVNFEANLTVNDREDGNRVVTITEITFEIPDEVPKDA
jgi:hypothetical protein